MKHTSILTLLLCAIFSSAGFIHAEGLTRAFRVMEEIPVRGISAAQMEKFAKQAAVKMETVVGLHKVLTVNNPITEQLRQTDNLVQICTRANEFCKQLKSYKDALGPLQRFEINADDWAQFVRDVNMDEKLANEQNIKDYVAVMETLRQYYSLDLIFSEPTSLVPADLFARSALYHASDHPGQMNLRLQHMMASFYVPMYMKKEIRTYLQQKQLDARLYYLLVSAYQLYSAHILEDLDGAYGKLPVKLYEDTAAAVQAFITETGHFPRMNAGPHERQLAAVVDLLLVRADVNDFQPIRPAIEHLRQLNTQYPVQVWSQDVFIAEYTNFLKKYPNEITPRPWQAQGYTEWDAILYDTFQYYLDRDRVGTLALMAQIRSQVRNP